MYSSTLPYGSMGTLTVLFDIGTTFIFLTHLCFVFHTLSLRPLDLDTKSLPNRIIFVQNRVSGFIHLLRIISCHLRRQSFRTCSFVENKNSQTQNNIIFDRGILCSPRLRLFGQNYSKNSTIVKYTATAKERKKVAVWI